MEASCLDRGSDTIGLRAELFAFALQRDPSGSYPSVATRSISTSAFFGRARTATVVRLGL
jgi:hypothetical protein